MGKSYSFRCRSFLLELNTKCFVHTCGLSLVSDQELTIVIIYTVMTLCAKATVRSARYCMICFTLLHGAQGSERSSIVGFVYRIWLATKRFDCCVHFCDNGLVNGESNNWESPINKAFPDPQRICLNVCNYIYTADSHGYRNDSAKHEPVLILSLTFNISGYILKTRIGSCILLKSCRAHVIFPAT